jgi:hypothetical protein
VLTAIGVILILVGILAILFGDKQIAVRGGGIILKFFDGRRADGEEGDFPIGRTKFLFGGALIVAGVLVLKAAAKVI